PPTGIELLSVRSKEMIFPFLLPRAMTRDSTSTSNSSLHREVIFTNNSCKCLDLFHI
ncbi:21826_t:CDS:1, partial [Gigaspora rosea]